MKWPFFLRAASLLLLFQFMFISSCDNVKVEDLLQKVNDLKSANWRDKLNKSFKLEGYLYFHENSNQIFVLQDLDLVHQNSILPEKGYILLDGENSFGQKILANPATYLGALVQITGLLVEALDAQAKAMKDLLGDISLARFRATGEPEVIAGPPATFEAPALLDPCVQNPALCAPASPQAQRFAVLYSGGINSTYAYQRYWNDLVYMYNTLKSRYGYTDDNIVVIYKDGTPEAAGMAVDYAATPAGFASAASYLNGRLTGAEPLFLFVTNHGGGWHQAEAANYGGLPDGTGGDESDPFRYDETVYYYNESSSFRDDNFAQWVEGLNFGSLIAVLEPCFSGGLIRDLAGPNRVLMSAATEFEPSWALPPSYQYDAFSYLFTAAVNGADHRGTAVNADANSDGKVSMLEAFLYARDNNPQPETPQYEDTGDGASVSNPSAGGEGALGSSAFL